jgi:hypothetical protein
LPTESRILSETVLSGSLDLTDDDDDDQKKNVLEESSFCEEIPEWMFWGMSSILITLPSAIWQTLTFVFKSDQDGQFSVLTQNIYFVCVSPVTDSQQLDSQVKTKLFGISSRITFCSGRISSLSQFLCT